MALAGGVRSGPAPPDELRGCRPLGRLDVLGPQGQLVAVELELSALVQARVIRVDRKFRWESNSKCIHLRPLISTNSFVNHCIPFFCFSMNDSIKLLKPGI